MRRIQATSRGCANRRSTICCPIGRPIGYRASCARVIA